MQEISEYRRVVGGFAGGRGHRPRIKAEPFRKVGKMYALDFVLCYCGLLWVTAAFLALETDTFTRKGMASTPRLVSAWQNHGGTKLTENARWVGSWHGKGGGTGIWTTELKIPMKAGRQLSADSVMKKRATIHRCFACQKIKNSGDVHEHPGPFPKNLREELQDQNVILPRRRSSVSDPSQATQQAELYPQTTQPALGAPGVVYGNAGQTMESQQLYQQEVGHYQSQQGHHQAEQEKVLGPSTDTSSSCYPEQQTYVEHHEAELAGNIVTEALNQQRQRNLHNSQGEERANGNPLEQSSSSASGVTVHHPDPHGSIDLQATANPASTHLQKEEVKIDTDPDSLSEKQSESSQNLRESARDWPSEGETKGNNVCMSASAANQALKAGGTPIPMEIQDSRIIGPPGSSDGRPDKSNTQPNQPRAQQQHWVMSKIGLQPDQTRSMESGATRNQLTESVYHQQQLPKENAGELSRNPATQRKYTDTRTGTVASNTQARADDISAHGNRSSDVTQLPRQQQLEHDTNFASPAGVTAMNSTVYMQNMHDQGYVTQSKNLQGQRELRTSIQTQEGGHNPQGRHSSLYADCVMTGGGRRIVKRGGEMEHGIEGESLWDSYDSSVPLNRDQMSGRVFERPHSYGENVFSSEQCENEQSMSYPQGAMYSMQYEGNYANPNGSGFQRGEQVGNAYALSGSNGLSRKSRVGEEQWERRERKVRFEKELEYIAEEQYTDPDWSEYHSHSQQVHGDEDMQAGFVHYESNQSGKTTRSRGLLESRRGESSRHESRRRKTLYGSPLHSSSLHQFGKFLEQKEHEREQRERERERTRANEREEDKRAIRNVLNTLMDEAEKSQDYNRAGFKEVNAQVESIKMEMAEMQAKIYPQLDSIQQEVKSTQVQVQKNVGEIQDIQKEQEKQRLQQEESYNQMQEAYAQMQDSHEEMREQLILTQQELIRTRQGVDRVEENSRRKNVKFYGVAEHTGNGRESCDQVVVDILNEYFPQKKWETNHLEKAHRIGKFDHDQDRHRPIVAKFVNPLDAFTILGNRTAREEMKKKSLHISQDLTWNQQEMIRREKDQGRIAYFLKGKFIVKGEQTQPGRPFLMGMGSRDQLASSRGSLTDGDSVMSGTWENPRENRAQFSQWTPYPSWGQRQRPGMRGLRGARGANNRYMWYPGPQMGSRAGSNASLSRAPTATPRDTPQTSPPGSPKTTKTKPQGSEMEKTNSKTDGSVSNTQKEGVDCTQREVNNPAVVQNTEGENAPALPVPSAAQDYSQQQTWQTWQAPQQQPYPFQEIAYQSFQPFHPISPYYFGRRGSTSRPRGRSTTLDPNIQQTRFQTPRTRIFQASGRGGELSGTQMEQMWQSKGTNTQEGQTNTLGGNWAVPEKVQSMKNNLPQEGKAPEKEQAKNKPDNQGGKTSAASPAHSGASASMQGEKPAAENEEQNKREEEETGQEEEGEDSESKGKNKGKGENQIKEMASKDLETTQTDAILLDSSEEEEIVSSSEEKVQEEAEQEIELEIDQFQDSETSIAENQHTLTEYDNSKGEGELQEPRTPQNPSGTNKTLAEGVSETKTTNISPVTETSQKKCPQKGEEEEERNFEQTDNGLVEPYAKASSKDQGWTSVQSKKSIRKAKRAASSTSKPNESPQVDKSKPRSTGTDDGKDKVGEKKPQGKESDTTTSEEGRIPLQERVNIALAMSASRETLLAANQDKQPMIHSFMTPESAGKNPPGGLGVGDGTGGGRGRVGGRGGGRGKAKTETEKGPGKAKTPQARTRAQSAKQNE